MKILIAAGSNAAFNQLRPEFESFISISHAGHEITVVIEEDSVYVPRLKELGIRMLHSYPHKKIDVPAIRAIRGELKRTRYDIAYATTSKTIPNVAFAAIGLPVKVVAYRGTTGGLYRHDPSAYLTILHPRLDGVICVSQAVCDDVRQRVWKNRDQVVAIHKGHELEWYQTEPADLAELNIRPDDFTVIGAVNVRHSKGVDILIDAVCKLAHLPDLHLILAGKGTDTEPCLSMIANSPMCDRIHALGFRTNAPQLIAASDVLVQPSRSGEGLPRAVMEAMGCGTPVIITDTGGGKEVVEDLKSGYVVPTEDSNAIADRIFRLYENRKLGRDLANNAKQRLSRDFSSAQTARKYITYFESLHN